MAAPSSLAQARPASTTTTGDERGSSGLQVEGEAMRLGSIETWRDPRVHAWSLAVTGATLLAMAAFGDSSSATDMVVALSVGVVTTIPVAIAMPDWPTGQAPWHGLTIFFTIEFIVSVG